MNICFLSSLLTDSDKTIYCMCTCVMSSRILT